ncbi:MAG: Gfo/Idh/MocA family oxidoreductase [Kiritimatiellae bacterium]|nr:Gfo/Idh/MocA family oxidoreductase [Kiritimatiellia bacterium]
MTRRGFLAGVSAAGASAASAARPESASSRAAGLGGAPMRDFAASPLKRIRVGIVGCGSRGSGAARRLPKVPGVEVAAVCDVRQYFLDKAVADVEKAAGRKPHAFGVAEDAWKGLCDWDGVDVVYNATPWHLHAPIAAYAMRAGKHVFVEVPSAMFVDECWELVETAEKTKRHCMQLENCCYGETELLALNLSALGMLGELLHGEGAYIHDRRWQIFNDTQWKAWRRTWNARHSGNQYSTHGLGPIAFDMGVNRGDRFDYLVSVDGVQRGYEAYAAATLPEGDPRRAIRFAMADMNVTTIRTAKGRTIVLQHDVTSPRPYSRINLVAGTKGVFRAWPKLNVFLEDKPPAKYVDGHSFSDTETERIRKEFMHPLYKAAGEMAKKVGGHGGMDYLMDLRWAYCLMNGLPLDADVYDLAAWCAVSELSERSARSRSKALDFPDFTRGAWKKECRCNLMDADIDLGKLPQASLQA